MANLVLVLVLLGIAYLVGTWGHWAMNLVRLPRSRSLGREAARAVMLATVPGLMVVGIVSILRSARGAEALGAGHLIVPWKIAAAVTAGSVVLLVALALRLSRRPPELDEGDPPSPSDRLFVPYALGALVTVGTTATTLGLSNGEEWWAVGAGLGLFLAAPVLALQGFAYWFLARREPPSLRRLLLFTVCPLLVVSAPLVGWTAYLAQPHVILAGLLDRPLPVSATDVRVERRYVGLFGSGAHLSFVLPREELSTLAMGFEPAGSPDSYLRDRGGGRWDRLWLDSTTGRVHYRHHTGID